MKGEKHSDTITEFYLEKKDVHGSPVKSWKHDYISISFIRLSTGKHQASKHQLINMLDTLFSDEISVNEKKKLLKQEHNMQMTRKLEGGIDTMCNVSQGIKEKALATGIAQGMAQGIAQGIEQGIEQGKLDTYLELLRDGLISVSDAAKRLCLSESTILEMLEN